MDRRTLFTGFSQAHSVQARGRSQCHTEPSFYERFNPAHGSGSPVQLKVMISIVASLIVHSQSTITVEKFVRFIPSQEASQLTALRLLNPGSDYKYEVVSINANGKVTHVASALDDNVLFVENSGKLVRRFGSTTGPIYLLETVGGSHNPDGSTLEDYYFSGEASIIAFDSYFLVKPQDQRLPFIIKKHKYWENIGLDWGMTKAVTVRLGNPYAVISEFSSKGNFAKEKTFTLNGWRFSYDFSDVLVYKQRAYVFLVNDSETNEYRGAIRRGNVVFASINLGTGVVKPIAKVFEAEEKEETERFRGKAILKGNSGTIYLRLKDKIVVYDQGS